ncbi:flavohemoprotein, partial [Actinoplanes sp. NPDC024001]
MSSGSGPASDPHLLALLRAIRLRQNAPDAAAAGAADTAAALSDLSGAKPAPGDEETGEHGTGSPPGPGTSLVHGGGGSGRSSSVEPVRRPPAPARPQPAERGTSDLLWRGDPGATLGRAG